MEQGIVRAFVQLPPLESSIIDSFPFHVLQQGQG